MRSAKLCTVYFAALVVAVLGWILNVGQLYWMSGVLLLLPAMGKLLSGLELFRLGVSRQLPARWLRWGTPFPVRLRATNALLLPKLFLSLADELPSGLQAVDPRPLAIHLPPHQSDEISYDVLAIRRGVHSLTRVHVHGTDLLGLSDASRAPTVKSEVVVYPKAIDLPPYLLPPEMGGGLAPMEAANRRGQGSGFFGIRAYRPGDPLRHVHWRSAARLGTLAVVEWDAEESRNALVVVETRQDSPVDLGAGWDTLDLAAGLAASLAFGILRGGGMVRLLAPPAAEWRVAAERGIDALPTLLDRLARMAATTERSVACALQDAAPSLEAGSLVFWLTSSPDNRLLTTAPYLVACGLRPVVYALGAPGEGVSTEGGASAWEGAARTLRVAGIPVIALAREDPLVRQLLTPGGSDA